VRARIRTAQIVLKFENGDPGITSIFAWGKDMRAVMREDGRTSKLDSGRKSNADHRVYRARRIARAAVSAEVSYPKKAVDKMLNLFTGATLTVRKIDVVSRVKGRRLICSSARSPSGRNQSLKFRDRGALPSRMPWRGCHRLRQ